MSACTHPPNENMKVNRRSKVRTNYLTPLHRLPSPTFHPWGAVPNWISGLRFDPVNLYIDLTNVETEQNDQVPTGNRTNGPGSQNEQELEMPAAPHILDRTCSNWGLFAKG